MNNGGDQTVLVSIKFLDQLMELNCLVTNIPQNIFVFHRRKNEVG